MESKNQARHIFTFFFLSAAMLFAGSALAAKVYRWVDENGEVHYSETLPPDFEDRKHDELDERGIIRAKDQDLVPAAPETKLEVPEPDELPRDSSGMKRPKRLHSESETKRRMDNFLLLRYDSEQEIENAMTVEINQLEYDRILLQTSRESTSKAYRGQIREAAIRQRSGVEVDPNIIEFISKLKVQLAANERSLAKLQIRQDGIIDKFGTELERYQKLSRDNP